MKLLSKLNLICLSILVALLSFTAAATTANHKVLSVEEIKADLEQLYLELQQAHFDLYANIDKSEYDSAYEKWQQGVTGSMTVMETQVYLQRFVALGDIAHASIDLPIPAFLEFWQQGGKSLPVYLSIRGDRAWIDEFYGEAGLVEHQQEVLALNGRPINQWLYDMAALISADNKMLRNTLIEQRLPFLLWLLLGEQDSFQLTLATDLGEKTIAVAALTRAQMQESEGLVGDDTGEDMQQRAARMLDNGIAYLRPGPFYNISPDAVDIWDNSQFVAFLDTAFTDFMEKDAKALLIDLRNNPGGTNSFSDPMIAWFADKPFKFASDFVVKISEQSIVSNQRRLEVSEQKATTSHQLAEFYAKHKLGETFSFPLEEVLPREQQRFDKPVFALVNRYSYSNAVTTAAMLQDYGFATLLGEKTADLATTYGAMEKFKLSNSGIEVGYPKALIVRPNGNQVPDGVTPDVEIEAGLTASAQHQLQDAVAYISRRLASRGAAN